MLSFMTSTLVWIAATIFFGILGMISGTAISHVNVNFGVLCLLTSTLVLPLFAVAEFNTRRKAYRVAAGVAS